MWHQLFGYVFGFVGGDGGVDPAADVAPETEEAVAGQSTDPAPAQDAKGNQA